MVEFELRSKNGRRKSMLGKNVVYLLSSESDFDTDEEAKCDKKSTKNRKPNNFEKSSTGKVFYHVGLKFDF
jgi:hypothetical protein